MPATSKRQLRFMRAAAHNPDFAAKAGIKQSVAEEYSHGQTGKGLPERVKGAAKKLARRRGK